MTAPAIKRRRFSPFAWFLVAANLIILLLLFAPAFLLFGEPVFHFAFGWIFSAARLVQHFEGSFAPLWWCVGLVGLATGVHFFVRSLQWPKRPALRFRASLSALGISFLALIAGMSIAGSVHQLSWLFTSKKSLFGTPLRDRAVAAAGLHHATQLASLLLKETKSPADWSRQWQSQKRADWETWGLPAETFATHLATDRDNKITRVYLWPRHEEAFRRIGGVTLTQTAASEHLPHEAFMTALRESYEPLASND